MTGEKGRGGVGLLGADPAAAPGATCEVTCSAAGRQGPLARVRHGRACSQSSGGLGSLRRVEGVGGGSGPKLVVGWGSVGWNEGTGGYGG